MDVEERLHHGARWLRSDDGARWAFWVAIVVSLPVLYLVGRHQWFTRDDWAFILTREKIHQTAGLSDMLFLPQDGHWMTIPIVVFRLTDRIFGIDSYWPYLLPTMVCHLATAVMVRKLCLRVGVRPWTAAILGAMLAVFGYGWENIVFGIQIVYNLSFLAFLVQLWLIDHDGPPNRRDALGVVAGLVSVMSSGFGPFFIVGTLCFMLMRRRWKAAAIAVGPTALAEAWWWLAWGSDPAGEKHGGSLTQLPAFVRRGFESVFEAMATTSLVGIALLSTLAVLLWRRRDRAAHDLIFSLAVTALLIYVGLGLQRGGFGTETAASSRYVYIGAALLMPAFGIAVDQLERVASPAIWAARVMLMAAVAMNAGALRSNGDKWADTAGGERTLLELIAGSPGFATLDPNIAPLEPSPDVHVGDLPELIAEGAIHPHVPASPGEQALVDAALSPKPVP